MTDKVRTPSWEVTETWNDGTPRGAKRVHAATAKKAAEKCQEEGVVVVSVVRIESEK